MHNLKAFREQLYHRCLRVNYFLKLHTTLSPIEPVLECIGLALLVRDRLPGQCHSDQCR